MSPTHKETNAHIAKIERNLLAIDSSGAEAGKPQTIAARMAALKIPAVSLAVFADGEIIWARAYGVSDHNTDQPANTHTLFQAASISKPLTATAVFRLIENGKLTLAEDVNAKLQSWHIPENEFTATEKITLRHILSHTAGLSVSGFGGYAIDSPLPTVPQILDGTPPANSAPVRVESTPGEKESYSGGGYTILQQLLEDVSGRPFAALMNDLVLEPAGMKESTFAQPLPETWAAHAASGYDENGLPIPGRYHIYPELAAAGLWTTPTDIARFMLSIGRSYWGEAPGLLQQQTAQTMLTKTPPGSGLGFGLSGEGDAFRYRHSGGNAGFVCYAVAFTSRGSGAVIMTNANAGYGFIQELTQAIAREYGWPPLWL